MSKKVEDFGAEMPETLRGELTDTRSPFSAEEKLHVVMAYLITGGNSFKAAKLAAIKDLKPATIRQWKNRAAWWRQAEEHARGLLQIDLDRGYTEMLHKTVEAIRDRVEKGNVSVDKEGKEVRRPLTALDLARIHDVLSQKRALIRGEPTSRTERVNPMDIYKELAKALHKEGEKIVQRDTVDSWEPLEPGRAAEGKPKTH